MPELPSTADSASVDAALAANLDRVLADLASASEATGRSAPGLVMVTKSVDADVTRRLCEVARARRPEGCVDLGENRADAFREKARALDAAGVDARWHFIGHLQRNKARRVLERADVLHSVDSVRLAATVARLADELERTIEVYVEVNLTGEAEKHGAVPAEVDDVLDALAACERVRVLGLMVMGPLEARASRPVDDVFADAQRLAAELESRRAGDLVDGRCRLSMGMSGDLEPAIRHGSSVVRIGSALFEGVRGGGADA